MLAKEQRVQVTRSRLLYRSSRMVSTLDRLLSVLLPRRTLEGLDGPRRVRIQGTVVSPDVVHSPWTNRRAAFFRWRVSGLLTIDRRFDRYEPVAERTSEPPVIVEVAGRRLSLEPTSRIAWGSTDWTGMPIEQLPDGW